MSAIFSLEMLPARKGDCLLLHYGTARSRRLWLIDGGAARVYPTLKKRLMDLKAGPAPLTLDLLMVSHHDDDHLNGLLDLCDDLERADSARRPRYVDVRDFWHNAFPDLLGEAPDPAASRALACSEADEVALASVRQGEKLAQAARRYDWPVNRPFGGVVGLGLVAGSRVTRFDPLTLTVIGPMKDEIDKLREEYRKFLLKRQEDEQAALQTLAAYTDRNPANLSSIVALVECEGRRMLLTGDARGDRILAGLEKLGLQRGEGQPPLAVDILKMPHHGSSANIEEDFFERIRADHYAFSGNGQHGNPERETLEMLFRARPEGGFTLHFNHALSEIETERQNAYARHPGKDRAGKPVPWSDKRHGLARFLADRKAAGVDFTVREPPAAGEALRIDLMGQPGG